MNRFFAYVFIASVFSSCSGNKANQESNVETANADTIVVTAAVEPEIVLPELNIDDFELDYFKEVAKEFGNESFATSPLSASFLLAMIANISDSLLQNQILQALKFDNLSQMNKKMLKNIRTLSKQSDNHKTLIGNSVWINSTLPVELGSRLDSLQKYYKATVEDVDFSNPLTTERIKQWGETATDGKLSPSVTGTDSTASILMNLIYASGNWISKFNEKSTKKRTFHKFERDSLVDMMCQETNAAYYNTKNFKAVIKKLEGGNSLILILPKNDLTPAELLSSFDSSTIKRIINNSQSQLLKLSVPRFEIDVEQSIKHPINEMGIILHPSLFKGLITDPSYAVYDITIDQISKIKVEESGVEASAQTVVEVTAILLSLDDDEEEIKPIVVTFDRPFIFLLRNDNTRSIIMSGIYAGPE